MRFFIYVTYLRNSKKLKVQIHFYCITIKMLIPYTCIRCGYNTHDKRLMRRHLYDKKKDCPGQINPIDLTDEIRETILKNKKYIIPNSEKTLLKTLEKKMNKLEITLEFLQNKKSEAFYQMLLEDFLNGTHKVLSCGITDITTNDLHAEIKDWSVWKDAIGQLLCYNNMDPKQHLHVYLFGTKRPDKEKRKSIYDNFKLSNIIPFELIYNPAIGSVDILDENETIVKHYSLNNL